LLAALIRHLARDDEALDVPSPTFTAGADLCAAAALTVVHARSRSRVTPAPASFAELGVDELAENARRRCLEWPDRAAEVLPARPARHCAFTLAAETRARTSAMPRSRGHPAPCASRIERRSPRSGHFF
jgi:tRNA A37 threonylcarbamoyladenosine biosynthesis protein TsaE